MQYNYPLTAFPTQKADIARLQSEIVASSITIAVDHLVLPGDGNCNIFFKADLSNDEKTVLDGIVAVHSGLPLQDPYTVDGMPKIAIDSAPKMQLKSEQDDGVPIFANAPRSGDEWVVGTHNFCDPCSWFGDSLRSNNETLVDSGDGKTFTSAHVNWIDMVSGRMHNDKLWVYLQQVTNPSDPHGYQVNIFIDGVIATMREPFEATGGDYEVIWDDGKVVFFQSQAGKTITASYSYEHGSIFYIYPRPGASTLIVEDAETDLSVDAIMTDTIVYGGWYFDGTNWVTTGEVEYKRAAQIVTEARGTYPLFKASGATQEELQIADIKEFRRKSRGMMCDVSAMPFNFATARHLPVGVQLRVYTRHGRVLRGEQITMTFYCTEI